MTVSRTRVTVCQVAVTSTPPFQLFQSGRHRRTLRQASLIVCVTRVLTWWLDATHRSESLSFSRLKRGSGAQPYVGNVPATKKYIIRKSLRNAVV